MRDAQHPRSPRAAVRADGASRRTVLRTAAWTAPAVVAVAAAPAHAASTTGSLLASWGTPYFTTDGTFRVLRARGTSVVSSVALAPGQLKLVVTFPLDSGEPTTFYGNGEASGWTTTSRQVSDPVVYTYGGAVAADGVAPYPDAALAVAPQGLAGTFQLVFTAGSVSSQGLSLPTDPS